MGNPRQRRKARSSSHKSVSLSRCARKRLKKMPPIQGPKVLQDAWDNKKTVRQNYTALGLVLALNPNASGGGEVGDKMKADGHVPDISFSVPTGFGRIVRDGAGNVAQIDMGAADSDDLPDEGSGVMKEPGIMAEAKAKWVTRIGKQSDDSYQSGGGQTLKVLEDLSMMPTSNTTMSIKVTGIGARHSSSGEIKYLQRLVNKYGWDVAGMAKDRRLNIEQRTVGELKRGLERSGLLAGKGGVREDAV